MEIRQLEYVVAVAEEASFTRAAARCHVAQPGISAQIRRLERELGAELFDRSGRTVRLTAVGEALLPLARAALAAVDEARAVAEAFAGLVRGRVRVGMVTACSIPDLFDLLAAFHERYPAVGIELSEANTDRLLTALAAGELNLALVATGAGPLPDGLAARTVAEEPVVAAVRPDDALAGAAALTPADLRGRALISLPAGTGIRAMVAGCWAAAGEPLAVALEANNPLVVAGLAARGLGVALVNPSSVALAGGLVAIPLAGLAPGRVALVWRVDDAGRPLGSAATRAMVAMARAEDAVRPR